MPFGFSSFSNFDPEGFYEDEEENQFSNFSPRTFRNPIQQEEPDYNEDEMGRLRDLTQRRSPGIDILHNYMQNKPTPETHKSSIWRKLGAVALGALSKSPGFAYEFANKPYLEALREHESQKPFVLEQAREASRRGNKELELEKFAIQQGARKRKEFLGQESDLLKNSMRTESELLRNQATQEKENFQRQRQLEADKRAERAERRSQEFHTGRMKKLNAPPKEREFEYKESSAGALREVEADEELHQKAIDRVVNNSMFKDYFVFKGKGDNVTVEMLPDLPESLKASLKRRIEDEYQSMRRQGRKTLPRRTVPLEEDFEEE